MSETRVLTLDAAAARALEERLRRELPPDAEWRRVDHARFAVKALGASVVCYTSGKLVVQGKVLDAFAREFLDGLAAAAPKAAGAKGAADAPLPFDAPTIGSDEAGKGDYFGPLVVASVYIEPAAAAELAALRVADSKTLSDQRMYPMAERIEQRFDCEVRTLMPPDYNARWAADPNVNHVLADLHADAIAALLARHPEATVVVDRFASEQVLAQRLRQRAAPRRLVQVPRAEAHPVVGAASIVARVHFLEGLARCQEDSGTDLHKGAGPPADEAARRAFAIGGRALLARVAKLHFKNSQRIEGLQP
ncbi:MAG: ribonuclease HIII [Planctomycetota bacterium]